MMETQATGRLRYRFDMLDTDGNGYLEARDFEALADSVIDAFRATATPEQQRAVRDGLERYWRGLLGGLDADVDGRVSLEEFVAGVHGDNADHVDAYAESIAEIADVDGDGFVERGDFETCMRALGFASALAEVFAELDADHDGRVTVGDWVAQIRDFYRSAAADAKGHQLASR